MEVDPLYFGVVWQLGAQEILCEWKEEWIPPNINEILEANVQRSVQTLKLEERLGIPARQ